MALTFVPSDVIEQAAREENWTDSDRQHCSRMLRQAFEESLQVKEIQRSVGPCGVKKLGSAAGWERVFGPVVVGG